MVIFLIHEALRSAEGAMQYAKGSSSEGQVQVQA